MRGKKILFRHCRKIRRAGAIGSEKAAALDINIICPLHGPWLFENIPYYLNLYDIWSSYGVESDGVVIAYTSVYGHTEKR